MAKLHIPAPGESPKKDPTELSNELWVGALLSAALIFCGWFFWIAPQLEEAVDPLAHIEDPKEREDHRDRTRFEELLGQRNWDVAHLSEEERARAFELAPGEVTEPLCEEQKEAIAASQLPAEQRRALLGSVVRRADNSPWICLTRQFLRDELPSEDELTVEMATFWDEVETLEHHGTIMADVVEAFRVERDRPDSERFYRWLRRCAMDFNYQGGPQCRRLIRQLSPDHGEDMLDMIVHHLGDGEPSTEELLEAVEALTVLAMQGQPPTWQVLETQALPDYDVDLRLGATYYLCRMMNSPDDEVLNLTKERIGRLAGIGGRQRNPHMTFRWRRACRAAFGDADDPYQPTPVIGVLTSDEDEGIQTHYGMDIFFEAGICEQEEGFPQWFCGAERWTGGSEPVGSVLGTHFAQSAYVEWYELNELAEMLNEEAVAEEM